MKNLKRNNWTNDEVIQLLEGCKFTCEKNASKETLQMVEDRNDGIDDCIYLFTDFKRPKEESGALALNTDNGHIYHIGSVLPI